MQARMNMDYFKYVIVIETLNSEWIVEMVIIKSFNNGELA
jgi:hypothetical protein